MDTFGKPSTPITREEFVDALPPGAKVTRIMARMPMEILSVKKAEELADSMPSEAAVVFDSRTNRIVDYLFLDEGCEYFRDNDNCVSVVGRNGTWAAYVIH
jgi:hypothetical protein